ncbi:hypothetical protein XELAEV_18018475mg [Xenopus laevis]|uniref:Uncharacterized protein n=1 Tax=Xenopus laevis TaxID=8355 RepID=A0A974DFR4_XENLA|nr:hypothetical protein XELAEV_18018475mg [Xenopus laevis]
MEFKVIDKHHALKNCHLFTQYTQHCYESALTICGNHRRSNLLDLNKTRKYCYPDTDIPQTCHHGLNVKLSHIAIEQKEKKAGLPRYKTYLLCMK